MANWYIKIKSFVKRVDSRLSRIDKSIEYPNIHSTARVSDTVVVYNKKNLYMDELTNIDADASIMNTRAKFIMKKWSGAAIGLTVITGNHMIIPGKIVKQITDADKDKLDVNHEYDKDVIVDEDVWLASNVTLLSGTHIGRGCIVGSGSVVRGNVPPYAILVGNPAKIVGFVFTPEEVKFHEEKLYSENERISLEKYERIYKKYFVNNRLNIQKILKL